MKRAGYLGVILVCGWLLGSFLGQLLSIAFPEGRIHEIFAWEQTFGLRPTTVDLRIVELSLGAVFRVSGTSLLGVLLSALLFKKLRG